jgi:glutamine amidotransferase
VIVVVDYGVGNVQSIKNLLRKAGADATVSCDPAVVGKAAKLILPGVGSFDTAMCSLRDRGLIPVLNRLAMVDRVPVLGLCLGLQLFTRSSQEGLASGLSWIPGETRRFAISASSLKVPHMGWNSIEPAKRDALLDGLGDPRFYFVHSYYVVCEDESDVLTWTTHGIRFASSVRRGNICGTQFHPEKSHKFGLALFKNFLALS